MSCTTADSARADTAGTRLRRSSKRRCRTPNICNNKNGNNKMTTTRRLGQRWPQQEMFTSIDWLVDQGHMLVFTTRNRMTNQTNHPCHKSHIQSPRVLVVHLSFCRGSDIIHDRLRPYDLQGPVGTSLPSAWQVSSSMTGFQHLVTEGQVVQVLFCRATGHDPSNDSSNR